MLIYIQWYRSIWISYFISFFWKVWLFGDSHPHPSIHLRGDVAMWGRQFVPPRYYPSLSPSTLLIVTSPFLLVKSPLLLLKSPFLLVKSQFLPVKSPCLWLKPHKIYLKSPHRFPHLGSVAWEAPRQPSAHVISPGKSPGKSPGASPFDGVMYESNIKYNVRIINIKKNCCMV